MNIMDNNNSIFVQAKIEYTKQLVNTLKPHMYDGIKSIYDDSKEIYKTNSSTSLLFVFRTLLEKIPEWNNELIVNETDRIIESSKCDWLDELVSAVYISHTKILMSIGNNNNNKINLTIPKLINFIHKCYINIARELWKNPLLFSEDISGFEYQKNINVIENIICDCIENTIRISFPVKEILKDHLDLDSSNKSSNKESSLLNELKELLMKNQEKSNNNDEEKQVIEGNEEDEETVDDNNVQEPADDEPDSNESTEQIETTINYESPDEEEINQKCENLEINDIPDINVQEGNSSEQVYDNPDIIDNSAEDNNALYEKLIKINETNKSEEPLIEAPVIVSKIEDNKETIESIIEPKKEETIVVEENLSVEEKLKKEEESRKYDNSTNGNIVDITENVSDNVKKVDDPIEITVTDKKEEKPLSYLEDEVEKEVISVDKINDDDNETVDMFYDDLKKMSDKKGLTMDAVDENKYTLFDDLD